MRKGFEISCLFIFIVIILALHILLPPGMSIVSLTLAFVGLLFYFFRLSSLHSLHVKLTHEVDKLVEEKNRLADSEARYRSVIDGMQDSLSYQKVVFNADGKPEDYIFLDINEPFEKLSGLKKQDIIGKSIKQISAGRPDPFFDWIKYYEHAVKIGSSVQFKYFVPTKNRKYSITIYIPSYGYFYASLHDITYIDQDDAVNSGTYHKPEDVITRFDKNLNCLYSSADPYYKNKKPMEVIFGSDDMVHSINSELHSAWETGVFDVFRSRQETIVQFEIKTILGSKYFDCRITPEFTLDGYVESVLVINSDCTYYKDAEESVKHVMEEISAANAMREAEKPKIDKDFKLSDHIIQIGRLELTEAKGNTENTKDNQSKRIKEKEKEKGNKELKELDIHKTVNRESNGIATSHQYTANSIYIDRLTGLYNRAFFDEEISRLTAAPRLPLSIIIGDVDWLSLANDAFGDKHGDELLKRVSGIILSSCSLDSAAFRLGGDEFAMILYGADELEASNVCTRIKDGCKRAENDLIKPSIALGSATLYDGTMTLEELIKQAEVRMEHNKSLEGRSVRSSIIASLIKTLEDRTMETKKHAERMQKLAEKLGSSLGLSVQEAEDLHLLCALHDIGKIGIPDNILMKTGRLTVDEWEIMKRHTQIGYNIAMASPDLEPIAQAILSHHENWDGTGYPNQLKGEDIPLIARIVSVIDAYDAMIYDRPYNRAIPQIAAIIEIDRCSGTQFDPRIVEVFKKELLT